MAEVAGFRVGEVKVKSLQRFLTEQPRQALPSSSGFRVCRTATERLAMDQVLLSSSTKISNNRRIAYLKKKNRISFTQCCDKYLNYLSSILTAIFQMNLG